MHKVGLLLLTVALLCSSLSAKESKKYSVRVVNGYATSADLGEILLAGKVNPDEKDLKVYSIDGGYMLNESLFDLPLDLYAKSGLSYYDEGKAKSSYGMDLYIKAIYNFDFESGDRVRFGFGEGVSYVSRKLVSEVLDASKDNPLDPDPVMKFLNYLDISLDVDFGRLIGNMALKDIYIGIMIKHRSGVFGLFNGVHGGSNYNSFYIEKNF